MCVCVFNVYWTNPIKYVCIKNQFTKSNKKVKVKYILLHHIYLYTHSISDEPF